jgi:GcrA cell cycle regulator
VRRWIARKASPFAAELAKDHCANSRRAPQRTASAAAKLKRQKNQACGHNTLFGVSGNLAFRDYLTGFWLALRLQAAFPNILERKMNYMNADIVDVAISEGGVTFTTYFADQEPIDGKLTVVDLTPSSCRWPTGNPRDLKTFRYCGEAAQGGPYCERHARLAYLPRLQKAA